MYESRLNEAKELKVKATAFRNRGQLDRALAALDKAIEALDSLQREKDLDSRSAVDVRAELADTYGMKGGIYRRLQQKQQALTEYRKGLKIEQIDQQSTYNLSNVITLGITEEHISPADPSMREMLDDAIKPLEEQVRGARSDEWWALTDLAQFYLLANKPDEARSYYERARKTGPTSQEYGRHIDILRELVEATKDNAPDISKNIAATTAYLERYAR